MDRVGISRIEPLAIAARPLTGPDRMTYQLPLPSGASASTDKAAVAGVDPRGRACPRAPGAALALPEVQHVEDGTANRPGCEPLQSGVGADVVFRDGEFAPAVFGHDFLQTANTLAIGVRQGGSEQQLEIDGSSQGQPEAFTDPVSDGVADPPTVVTTPSKISNSFFMLALWGERALAPDVDTARNNCDVVSEGEVGEILEQAGLARP